MSLYQTLKMGPMSASSGVASISAFTPRNFYQPHRASNPFISAVEFPVPLQDWYSLAPQLPLSVSAARPAPRPRPRYLHATASGAAAGPQSPLRTAALSGQYSFFFGGIALQTFPLASPAKYPMAEPALLSDLWMVDSLANTTTLLHGDPALLRLPAGLGVGGLVSGIYSPSLWPAARHSASLAYDASTRIIWLFGGAYYPIITANVLKQAFFDDMWSFSLDKRQWAWWRGNTAAQPRPSSASAIDNLSPPPPTAAAAMAAHGKIIVIYGGYKLASTQNPAGYNSVYESDSMYIADNLSDGTTLSWHRVLGSETSSDSNLPLRGGASTPAARAYAALVWETHNTATANTLVMYGGTLSALLLSAPSAVDTTLQTAPGPENDSGVLAGLWLLSLTPPALAAWQRLDEKAGTPTAGERGQPRVIFPASSNLPSLPGGRVFHAMNTAANGDIFLYGGRGHGLGAFVRPDGTDGVQTAIDALPAAAPFTLPLKGRFNSTVTESNALSLHAFLYSSDEFLAAGLPVDSNLPSLDIMVKLGQHSMLSESGTWDRSSRFRVRTLLVPTLLGDFDNAGPHYLDAIELSLLKQPGVMIDPLNWAPGTFMAINTPYMKDVQDDTDTLSSTLSSGNAILYMAIEYVFVGAGIDTSQAVKFGLAMHEGQTVRSMSLLKYATPEASKTSRNFDRYTARPVLLLRSPLHSHPLTQPPVTIALHAAPQLDDLWQFFRANLTWRLVRAFSAPITRTGSNVTRSGVPGSEVPFPYSPGARLGATLSIPSSSLLSARVTTDTSLFLRGGWTVGSTHVAEQAFFANPAVERGLESCEQLTVHDDLWTIDVIHTPTNLTCIDSTAYGSDACHNSTLQNNMNALFTPWLPQNDIVYGEQIRTSLTSSKGNTCPSSFSLIYCGAMGACVAGGGSSFCHCNSYTQGAQCANGNVSVDAAKAKFELRHGSVLLAGNTAPTVLPFAAVAHRPGTGEVYSFGGMTINSVTGVATASAAFTRVNLIANTMTAMPRNSAYAETHTFTQALIPAFSIGKTYVNATAPPPSLESHAWFSPDG